MIGLNYRGTSRVTAKVAVRGYDLGLLQGLRAERAGPFRSSITDRRRALSISRATSSLNEVFLSTPSSSVASRRLDKIKIQKQYECSHTYIHACIHTYIHATYLHTYLALYLVHMCAGTAIPKIRTSTLC